MWVSLFFFAVASAEKLGSIGIEDVLLRPQFQLSEPFEGEFSIGESQFQVNWKKDDDFRGVLTLGPRSLLGVPAHYITEETEGVDVVEAFAEFVGVYGRVRAGLLPLGYSFEGGLKERDLQFPRSLFFRNRVVGLRDLGLSYDIEHRGFYSGFVAHNGEGGGNEDGRVWYTARWGYKNKGYDLGFSGQTGTTKPESTSTSGDTLADVDPSKEAEWHTFSFFGKWANSKFESLLEAHVGELNQENDEPHRQFYAGHLDFIYRPQKKTHVGLRYDHFDPYSRVRGDIQGEVSLAVALHSENSSLFLIGTKVLEERNEEANDRLLLIWQLSPSLTEASP